MNYPSRHVCVPKYRNQKTVAETKDGLQTFDSRKEARRYQFLRFLEMNGRISDLKTQVRYEVIPKQENESGDVVRPCVYIADFVYTQDGKTIVEDVKGYKNGTAYELFKLKKKLMLYRFGITVKEV